MSFFARAGPPLAPHYLRHESEGNIYRLFYAFLPGKRILFLHSFQKKTQTTPRREIEVAQRRLESFRQRQRGA